MSQSSNARSVLFTAVFASGAAALIHEVAWARLIANWIGSTAAAQAIVLAVFMFGLAAGAVLFGRRSDRGRSPATIYAGLELVIGLYCVALPTFGSWAGGLYERSVAAHFESEGWRFGLRLCLSAVLVAVPAVCMGGTLPVLVRSLSMRGADTRTSIAGIYALNNLGAVAGTLAAGFLLLPALGIQSSLVVGALLNAAAAVLAKLAGPEGASEPHGGDDPSAREAGSSLGSLGSYATLLALALSGFAAMSYEVVFVRVIALGFGSSAYSFTLMLVGFITGLGVGSLIVSKLQVRRPLWWLAASQLGAAAALALVVPLVERLPYWAGSLRAAFSGSPSGFGAYLVGQGAIVLALLIVPTALIGIGFPLVAYVQSAASSRVGSKVGATYAWNTVGNVLGTLVTTLVLIPSIGIGGALHVSLALQVVAGLLLLAFALGARPVERGTVVGATAVVLLFYAAFGRHWHTTLNHAADHLRLREGPPPVANDAQRALHPLASFANWKKRYVIDFAKWPKAVLVEDADSTTIAIGNDREAYLYVNGKGDASAGAMDMLTMEMLAHAPLFLLPQAKSVCLVGYGSGVSCGSALQHPIESLDLVEISQGVLDADVVFRKLNRGALADPRLRVYREDARTFLRTTPRKYDLILSQPSNPWIAGIGSLFTVEYYRDAAARLEPGGALCVWFHQYEQSDEAVELVLRSLHEVFPHVQIFFSYNSEVIAIASREALEPDFGAMEARFERPELRRDLARVAFFNLSAFLAYHAFADSRSAQIFGPGPLNTDDHQRLEYWGARNLFFGTEAELLRTRDGYSPLPEGHSDYLLHRYAAWRKAQGEPIAREELAFTSALFAGLVFLPEHRMTQSLATFVEGLAPAPSAPSSVARGALPPNESLDFAEALNRSRALSAAGDLEGSRALIERALELEPGHPVATGMLAERLVGEGKLPEASALFDRALELRPTDQDLSISAMRFFFQTDQHEKARVPCERLVADPSTTNVEALTLMGILETEAARYGSSVLLYRRALELDPTYWQAAVGLIELLASNPSTGAEAAELLERSLQLLPDNPALLDVKARLSQAAASTLPAVPALK